MYVYSAYSQAVYRFPHAIQYLLSVFTCCLNENDNRYVLLTLIICHPRCASTDVCYLYNLHLFFNILFLQAILASADR